MRSGDVVTLGPSFATVAGFAPGGFVFLIVHDVGTHKLQKVRVR